MSGGTADGLAIVFGAAMAGTATWAINDLLDLQGTAFEQEEFKIRFFVALVIACVFFGGARMVLHSMFVS